MNENKTQTPSRSLRVTVPSLRERKGTRQTISALTAYDYTFARLLDRAGVDVLLVGDSLSSVIQGLKNTLPVSLEQMIYHCQCVSRGASRALVVGDMPFLSYQPSIERAIESAGRLLKEGGVAAVKLEGGIAVADRISALVSFDIPVMGHVGLTPQSYHRMGGHKIQGKDTLGDGPGSRDRIIKDAKAVEDAGAFAVVLEGIPHDLASEITGMLSIPTIGISAGTHCDGQILVTHDLLGLTLEDKPGFVEPKVNLGTIINQAIGQYLNEL